MAYDLYSFIADEHTNGFRHDFDFICTVDCPANGQLATDACDTDEYQFTLVAHGTVIAERTVAVHKLSDVLKTVVSLNKKATRYGVEPLKIEVSPDQHLVTLKIPNRFEPSDASLDKVITFLAHTVVVTGQRPHLNGWELLATLQHTDDGTIIRSLPGFEGADLTSYRTASPQHCDHCGFIRTRKDTYVVRHDDGRMAQIGRTCLKDYMNGANVESAIRSAALLDELRKVLDHNTDMRDDATIPTDEYLSWVAGSIAANGWLSKGAAYQNGGYATAQCAIDNWDNFSRDNRKYAHLEPSDANVAEAEAALSFARDTLSAKYVEDSLNDYEHNLWVSIQSTHITSRQLGIVASVLPYVTRQQSQAAKAVACVNQPMVASVFLGAKGDKLNVPATLLDYRTGEGSFGTWHLYKFDVNGNVATWFASSRQDIKIGAKVTLTGTIKSLDTYQNTNQTVLTRCKMKPA